MVRTFELWDGGTLMRATGQIEKREGSIRLGVQLLSVRRFSPTCSNPEVISYNQLSNQLVFMSNAEN